MTSNSAEIAQRVQHDFQNLLAYITGSEAQSQTADTVELTLFRRLLALGAALLRLFVVTRAAVRPVGACPGPGWHAPEVARAALPRPTTRSMAKCDLGGTTSPRRARGDLSARYRVELAGALILRPAVRVGSVWDDRRVLPREPDGDRAYPGGVAQRPGHGGQRRGCRG